MDRMFWKIHACGYAIISLDKKKESGMGNPAWVVKKVIPRKDYTLLLTFEDGKNGIYDFRPDLSRPIFRKQQNIDFFMQAKALYGTVVWPDDSDISPEHLYEKSTSIK